MLRSTSDIVIGFVIYPGVTLLDVAGPLQVLTRIGPPVRSVLVGARLTPTATDTAVALTANHTFAQLPAPSVLMVPGGGLGLIKAMVDPDVQHYLSTSAPQARFVASTCTGSLLLASAGLLEGRRATTHWGHAAFLERLGVRYEHATWVEDGPYLTAASSRDGIDMALRLAALLTDGETAMRLAASIAHDGEAATSAGAVGRGAPRSEPLAHLSRSEATGRLAAMRMVLAARPDLLERLAP
jgi:transcriptional regulator GlxA family with amidase domain